MKVEQVRANVLQLTVTTQELSGLIASTRLTLDAMRHDPAGAPSELVELLEQIMRDYERATDASIET